MSNIIKSKQINDNDLINYVKINNDLRIVKNSYHNTVARMQKLDSNTGLNLETGEVIEFKRSQNRSQRMCDFKRSLSTLRDIIKLNVVELEKCFFITLTYPCLNIDTMWQSFYAPHRKLGNPLYNDDCIYTPNVCVFKSDTSFPESLPQEEWWSVNILTCAAPNLRERPSNAMNPCAGNKAAKVTPAELEKLLTSRIQRIFEIAANNENDVLILGAFGCGAFRNPPEIVAKVFYEVMQEFLCCFDTIEYAVYHTERELANYEAFKKVIG